MIVGYGAGLVTRRVCAAIGVERNGERIWCNDFCDGKIIDFDTRIGAIGQTAVQVCSIINGCCVIGGSA